jgi:hypothetical protein
MTTPIRRQYLSIKREYPDVIVFFRLGDFYETFDDDAKLASSVLDITLTSREMGKNTRVPMAGIPYHAAQNYVNRLIDAGHKVAIVEQIGEPDGRQPVERKVTRVVTPGTVTEPSMLESESNRVNPAAREELARYIRREHSTVLEINAEMIGRDGTLPPLPNLVKLVRSLLEQRLKEAIHDGAATDVKIYAQAPLHEAFELGRALGHERVRSLEVMHLPHVGDLLAVPGVRLGHALQQRVKDDDGSRAREIFGWSRPAPRIQPIPDCPADSMHRLAVVVRLSNAGEMVQDITQIVAPTGRVVRPDGSPTGYVLTPQPDTGQSPTEARGEPCGAFTVVETTGGQIPENNDAFEAVVTYIARAIDIARGQWRERTGRSVTTLLFIAGPLPIVMGLGWLLRSENVTVVEHRRIEPTALKPKEASGCI